jgi:hypothetical protein
MNESYYETKTTVFDREHAEYTMVSFADKETSDIRHHELSIKEKDSSGLLNTTRMLVDDGCDIVGIILNTEKKLHLIKLLDEFTQEMEGYSYYGSNPGISTDDYEDVADLILEKFFLKQGRVSDDV